MPQDNPQSSEPTPASASAPREDLTPLKIKLLSYLEVALARYPRKPGETLKSWLDRFMPEHADADEFHLAYAAGMAEGAGIDIVTEDFELALSEGPDENHHPMTGELAIAAPDSPPTSGSAKSPWRKKPLFVVDEASWVTVRVRFNRDHYMSNNLYGCVGSSRVGIEVERALAEGHTYDSIFQEGMTKIRQLDGNYIMVPIGDLIAWSEARPDFYSAFVALRKSGVDAAEVFQAGLAALRPERTRTDAVAELVARFGCPNTRYISSWTRCFACEKSLSRSTCRT